MNTDQLISHSRARFEHATARRVLREKYQAKLTFAHAGGLFQATPEMITFLSMWGNDHIVVKDLYDNPVAVHAVELCNIMKSHHQEQMNAWLTEHNQLSQQR